MYGVEWTPGPVLLGIVLILPIAPHFALIALMVVALAAVVALAGLARMLAMPYRLVRSLRRHRAEQRRSTEDSVPTYELSAIEIRSHLMGLQAKRALAFERAARVGLPVHGDRDGQIEATTAYVSVSHPEAAVPQILDAAALSAAA